MLCKSVYIFHFYSRKSSDRIEQYLSYLWIFLWPLRTSWSLRNHLYSKKSRKKGYEHAFALVAGCRDISRSPLSRGGGWTGFTIFERVLMYISDFWGCFWFPGAIKISTDSWDDVLHDPILYVSRSGKITLIYIVYMLVWNVKSDIRNEAESI